jgi:hypothetical protein
VGYQGVATFNGPPGIPYIARHAREELEQEFLAMYDAYWLVCSLPGVIAHQVHSLDQARAIFAEALGIIDYSRIIGGLIQ